MSVKKVLLTISAMALIAVIAVAGTLAFLNANTDTVTNTFASAGLIDPGTDEDPNFKLVEHTAEQLEENNGNYTLTTAETKDGFNYNNVLPGTTLAKDPKVTVKNLKQNAYLFIKVEDTLNTELKYTINSANWTKVDDAKLDNANLPAGTTIYVYKRGEVLNSKNGVDAAEIITNNEVKATGTYAADGAAGNLKFTAYLAQTAGFDDYTSAWNHVFGGVTE